MRNIISVNCPNLWLVVSVRLLICTHMNRNWCPQVCKNILQRLKEVWIAPWNHSIRLFSIFVCAFVFFPPKYPRAVSGLVGFNLTVSLASGAHCRAQRRRCLQRRRIKPPPLMRVEETRRRNGCTGVSERQVCSALLYFVVINGWEKCGY